MFSNFALKRVSRWPYVILIILFCVLLVRSFFSFNQNDESFYLSLVHRLWLGEKLILEEWHPTQFYAPVLLPFYALYKLISPSGDGVILFFRIVYVTLSFFSAIYVYKFFSKVTCPFLALAMASIVMLYSRANISGMSYYNICFLCSVILACLYLDHKAPIFAGILCAIMVLCNPYMAIIVIPLVVYLFSRDRKYIIKLCVAIAIAAIIYLAFFINKIPEQFSALKFVLSDPSHQLNILSRGDTVKVQIYELTFKRIYIYLAITFFLLFLIKKNETYDRIKNRIIIPLWLIISLAVILLSVAKSASSVVASVTVPLTISAIPCFALMIQKKSFDAVGVTFYIWGLAVAAMFFFASNTSVDAMTVGFTISSMGSILLLGSLIASNSKHFDTVTDKVLVSIIVTCFLICISLQRVVGVYRDDKLINLDTQLTSGPAQGLYTSAEHANQYNELLSVIEKVYNENPTGSVLHFKWLPWAYISTNWNYGVSSSWNASNSVLEQYYSVNPNKLPDIVFVYEPEVGSWEYSSYNNHGACADPNNNPDDYLCVLKDNNYIMIHKSEYVTVYRLSC